MDNHQPALRTVALVVVFSLWFVASVRAQEQKFKVGDQVELYDGGSAYVIRTQVLKIDNQGNLTVRYKTPFSRKGISNVTLPSTKFWKVGEDPNPAPENEFRLGDKVDFYFRNTDVTGRGVVVGISTNGEYYTIQ